MEIKDFNWDEVVNFFSKKYILTKASFSEKYSIEVMPRPQIKKVIMTLYQPAYISSKPEILPENTNETELSGRRLNN